MNAEQAVPNRSEDEIFARFGLKLTLGGIIKPIRELPARRSEAWRAQLGAAIAGRLGSVAQIDSVEAIVGSLAGLTEVQAQLLVSYDQDGRLGGFDWIVENASPSEIWVAFKQVVLAAFPFLADAAKAPSVVGLLLPRLVELLPNGPSPTGERT